jgi:hypothetical protein
MAKAEVERASSPLTGHQIGICHRHCGPLCIYPITQSYPPQANRQIKLLMRTRVAAFRSSPIFESDLHGLRSPSSWASAARKCLRREWCRGSLELCMEILCNFMYRLRTVFSDSLHVECRRLLYPSIIRPIYLYGQVDIQLEEFPKRRPMLGSVNSQQLLPRSLFVEFPEPGSSYSRASQSELLAYTVDG